MGYTDDPDGSFIAWKMLCLSAHIIIRLHDLFRVFFLVPSVTRFNLGHIIISYSLILRLFAFLNDSTFIKNKEFYPSFEPRHDKTNKTSVRQAKT